MKYKVLISSFHMNQVIKDYKKKLTENNIEITSIIKNPVVKEQQLLEIIENFDGIICSDDEITSQVIDKAKKLKVICKWGTGIDSIDIEKAKQKGIRIFNSPNAFSESVASLVWGLILNLYRKISLTDKKIRIGEWPKIQGQNIFNKTIGIIGVGNIGKKIISSSIGFDLKILANDIVRIDEDFVNKYNISLVNKDYLYEHSDIIVLCVNLNEKNVNLINKNSFIKMKKKPLIINISRGPVINENDLIHSLKNEIISGAGLDVFENEPIDINNELLNFENCILSSHNAFNTFDAVDYVNKNTIENMITALKKNNFNINEN